MADQDRDYFATCTLGLEAVLADELQELGAREVRPIKGGAAFAGDLALGYRANLWLRSATRVQELLLEFPARDERQLYEGARSLDWDLLMRLDQTLAVEASVRDSALTHSGFVALKVKDAIVDQFRDRAGERPNVDARHPHLPLFLMLKRDRAALYRNLSGPSLHKRGYRPIQVKSPLNEATAAGLLLLSGWDRKSALVDPMCGSATFLIEAAWMALDVAPGIKRSFAFEKWVDCDAAAWSTLRKEALARRKTALPFRFEGADRHAGSLTLAKLAVESAGVAANVDLTQAAIGDFVPRSEAFTVCVNPPWGERVGEGEDLAASWQDLGRFLHRKCGGRTACVLSGDEGLTRHLGLRASLRFPVRNGPIDCRWLRYDVFEKPQPAADGEALP